MNEEAIRGKIEILLKEVDKLRFIDSRQAMEISNDALILCKETGYIIGEKVANFYIANCYYNIGENDNALSLLLDSLHYFVKEELQDLKWMAYNLLGNLFLHIGDMERSMDAYNNALAAAEKIDKGKKYDSEFNSNKALVRTFNNIAENYKDLKQYKEALNYCKKAYDIDVDFEYSLSQGIILLSLGEIYYLMGDYEKADSFAYKSLEYVRKYKYIIAEANAYRLMALTSWKKGNYHKADEYFNISMNLNKKESVPGYYIDSLISYFEYLKEQNKSDEAIEVLTNACNLSIQFKLFEKTSKISIMLSKFYGDLGDYKNSFEYTKLHYDYEELYSESYNTNIINSLNIKKKIQDIEKENNNLQVQRQSLEMLVDKISIISELGQRITSTLNMDLLMEILYSSIKSFMKLSYFAVGLYDEKAFSVKYLYIMDREQRKEPKAVLINEGQTIVGECINSKEIIVINNARKETKRYMDEATFDRMLKYKNNAELNSLMFCPLIINTKVIGVMTVQSEEEEAFNQYYVEMLKSLSAYAAIAINNAMKSKELEDLNQVLLSLAEKDQLTGIANRRKFDDYIENTWKTSIETGDNLALFVIDVDHFKEYNDNYGHLEGDKCLASIAKALSCINIRPYFVARYGGDEFMIVLSKCSSDEAIKFGELIKAKIAELNIPHKFSKVSDIVTLSIGIACMVPNEDIKLKEFIRQADEQLYVAKKLGKNRVVYQGC